MGLKRERHPELGDAISTLEAIKRKIEADIAKLATELRVSQVFCSALYSLFQLNFDNRFLSSVFLHASS